MALQDKYKEMSFVKFKMENQSSYGRIIEIVE
jgi:hypothetical protein